jgi:hypothetical protein
VSGQNPFAEIPVRLKCDENRQPSHSLRTSVWQKQTLAACAEETPPLLSDSLCQDEVLPFDVWRRIIKGGRRQWFWHGHCSGWTVECIAVSWETSAKNGKTIGTARFTRRSCYFLVPKYKATDAWNHSSDDAPLRMKQHLTVNSSC